MGLAQSLRISKRISSLIAIFVALTVLLFYNQSVNDDVRTKERRYPLIVDPFQSDVIAAETTVNTNIHITNQEHSFTNRVQNAPAHLLAPVSGRLRYLQTTLRNPVCEEGSIDHGCYCISGKNGRYPPKFKILGRGVLRERNCSRQAPAVIIPGSMKSGTTALKFYLSLHPALAFAEKELKFASTHNVHEFDQYRTVMPFSTPDQIPAEKTAGYFIRPAIAKRIKAAMPRTKIVLILRDPIQRALSNYAHMLCKNETDGGIEVGNGSAPKYEIGPTFRESVLFSNGSLKTNNRLLDSGIYAKYLRQWFAYFPREQILVLDGEAFIRDPVPSLRQVEEFLGVDHFYNQDKFYFDEMKGFICLKEPLWMCMDGAKGRKHEDISLDLMVKLKHYFRPHNRKLAELLNRELSWTMR